MLQSEITPFAEAHRIAISEIIQELQTISTNPLGGHVTQSQALKWIEKLQTTQTGFNRFEACMTDEWNQKERYRKAALECRLNHK